MCTVIQVILSVCVLNISYCTTLNLFKNFKVCSCVLYSGITFLGVSIKSPLIALILIHISMFLAELGFLQQKRNLKILYSFIFHTPWQYFAWISCALLLALIWLS